MNIQQVAEALERFAPLPLQEDYDNAGLQIGLTAAEDVSGVLLCLDVTENVVREAVAKHCNMIVAHHPLIFRPLSHLTGQTQVERCVAMALQKGVAVYAAHTNLDNAPGGVNFMMAEKLALGQVRFLQQVKDTFGVQALHHNALPSRLIRKVALCGGAGDFLLDAAIRQQADAFLTGEMGYHRYFGHEDEILIGVLGHYQSEQFTIQLMQRILHEALPDLRTVVTGENTNPIHTV